LSHPDAFDPESQIPESQISSGRTFRSQLLPLLLLTGIVFSTMLPRAAFSPLLLPIEESLGISHAQAASFFLAISLGVSLSLFFSGIISSRLTHRNTIVLSTWLSGASLIVFANVPSFGAMQLVLFLFGMGFGLYPPSGMATITSLVKSREWGRALALHETGPNLGPVVAPLLSGLLLSWFSWRTIMTALGVVTLLMGAIFLLLGRGGRFCGSPPRFKNLKPLLCTPSFWILSILLGISLGSAMGVYAVLPTYLISERSMAGTTANTVVGLSRIAVLVSVFLSGWIADRIGHRRAMTVFLVSGGFLTVCLGILSGAPLITAAFLQPVFSTCFFPPALAAVAGMGPAETRNISYSTVLPIVSLTGTGIVPSMLGFFGDHLSFAMGLIILGLVQLAATTLLLIPVTRQTG